MKAIIKLLIAAAVLNATGRVALSAWTQYEFQDEVQQTLLFADRQSVTELRREILDLASKQRIPLADDDLEVSREGQLLVADATYTDHIEVFPRYFYDKKWSFRVDARQIAVASSGSGRTRR